MPRTKWFIYIALGFLALGAVFLLSTLVFASRSSASPQTLNDHIGQLKSQEARLLADEALCRQWRDIDKAYAAFKAAYITPTVGFPIFRNDLEAIFTANGLRTSRYSFQTNRIAASLTKMTIRFSVKGEYSQLKRMLYSLENFPRLITLNQVSLHAAGEETLATVSLEVYLGE